MEMNVAVILSTAKDLQPRSVVNQYRFLAQFTLSEANGLGTTEGCYNSPVLMGVVR